MYSFQILLNIFFSSSIFLLIATSFSIIYFSTRFFHIVHAAIITAGAYFAFLFAFKMALPLPLAIVLAVVTTSILGMLSEVLVYRQMRKRNFPTLAYLITSLGLYIVLQNIISLYFGDDTKVLNTTEVTVGHQIFGAYITTVQMVTVFVSIALFIATKLFLHFAKVGKSIRAVASNLKLCDIYGINSNRIILIAFGIGSALAAIAGILSAMDTNMTPTFGFNLLLYGVVVMIIGGIGSTRGLIAGSLVVAAAQHLSAYYIDTKWMDAITYVILISFLIWKPLGFSGKQLKKIEV
ncbi:MAG: branched-chain amino acid ABC transporter permease [Candidatus Kapabacteria bacterium]|nr:branched-chain amino acid ABC transporter permease [Candidatus Kapabacteria bacterium]